MKLLLFIALLALAQPTRETNVPLYFYSGDLPTYLIPVEQLLKTGDYWLDPRIPSSRVYRMPGYALTILPFRIVFGQEWDLVALAFFQVALGGFAAYCVALLAYRVTPRRLVFLAAYLFALLPTFPSVLDAWILPDGPASSLLVIACLLLSMFVDDQRAWRVLGAGTIAAYLVFLRPFAAPVVVFFALFAFVFAQPRRDESPVFWRRLRIPLLALLMPALTESAWVTRNWITLGVFQPLHTAGFGLPAAEAAVRDWIMSFGGDDVWWRPGTVGAWLWTKSPYHTRPFALPEATLTADCNAKTVLAGRDLFIDYQREASAAERKRLAAAVIVVFRKCRESYIFHRPIDHIVVAPMRLLGSFLVHAGPVLPLQAFRDLPPFGPAWSYKLATVSAYWAALLGGVPGLLLLLRRPTPTAWLILGVLAYLLTLFPLVLRMVETRYLAMAHPLLIAVGAAGLGRVAPVWQRDLPTAPSASEGTLRGRVP